MVCCVLSFAVCLAFFLLVLCFSLFFFFLFCFLMIRRPPRSTLDRSSAASDVYKRQPPSTRISSRQGQPSTLGSGGTRSYLRITARTCSASTPWRSAAAHSSARSTGRSSATKPEAVSYTHLRAHETVLDLVCRLLLEKKK